MTLDPQPSPRSFDHERFCVDDLLHRDESVCILLPAREEAASIGTILDVLVALRGRGAIDEVLVVDASSVDGTGQIATERGATVFQRETLLPEFGPALGKGDAVWRGLSATQADIVCVLDADLTDFDERFVLGLVGPLLLESDLGLVKGAFDRPYRDSTGAVTPSEGGRVTELMARPLLKLWYPELALFDQPLSGQWAARRDLVIELSFWTGYALEICLLLEAYEHAGIAALAQSHLGSLHNRHQSLQELSSMAHEVLVGVTQRLDWLGHLGCPPPGAVAPGVTPQVRRRPPLVSLADDAIAGRLPPQTEHERV